MFSWHFSQWFKCCSASWRFVMTLCTLSWQNHYPVYQEKGVSWRGSLNEVENVHGLVFCWLQGQEKSCLKSACRLNSVHGWLQTCSVCRCVRVNGRGFSVMVTFSCFSPCDSMHQITTFPGWRVVSPLTPPGIFAYANMWFDTLLVIIVMCDPYHCLHLLGVS